MNGVRGDCPAVFHAFFNRALVRHLHLGMRHF